MTKTERFLSTIGWLCIVGMSMPIVLYFGFGYRMSEFAGLGWIIGFLAVSICFMVPAEKLRHAREAMMPQSTPPEKPVERPPTTV